MKRFNNLRIRTKLGLSFGLILLIVAGLGQFSTMQLSRVNAAAAEITARWLPSVKWLASLRGDCNEYRRYDLNLLLSETVERRRNWMTRNEEVWTKIKLDESKYEPLIGSPEEKRTYEDFRERLDNYLSIHKRLVDLTLANRSKEARELSAKEGVEAFNAAMAVLQKDIDLNDQGAQNAAARSSATYSSSRYSIISIVVGAVIAGLLMAFFVSRAITQPLSQAADRFKDIAQGEGDLTARLEADREDEVGELSRWFNTFMDKLHGVISKVASSAEQVASASEEISSGATQSAGAARTQADQIQQVATAMEEMSSTVQQVSESTQRASEASRKGTETARQGGQVVKETLATMRSIFDSTKAVASRIGELGKSSEQIGKNRCGYQRHRRSDKPPGSERRHRSCSRR